MKNTGKIGLLLILLFLCLGLFFYTKQQNKTVKTPLPRAGTAEEGKAAALLAPLPAEQEKQDSGKKSGGKTRINGKANTKSRPQEKDSSVWVKILNYHAIFPEAYLKSEDPKLNRFTKPSDRKLIVSAENFEKQMDFLSKNYKVVSFSDFAERIEKKQPYGENAVIITFDGADETIYKIAYPVLKKYNLPATLFLHINALKLDKTAMKWDTIKLLHDEGLMEIESHSISHPHLNRMLKNETQEAYEARIRKELVDSKNIIEEKLNKKVLYFAYPYGGYNATVIGLLKESGYKASVTVQWDKNTVFTNPYALRRRGVFNDHTLKKFEEIFTVKVKDDPREYAD